MKIYTIRIELLSDATFGSGDGIAGLLNQDVEHDQFGFPFLRGRSLKGLLSDECDTLIHNWDATIQATLLPYRNELFGKSGDVLDSNAKLFFNDAVLPALLRSELQKLGTDNQARTTILDGLTVIRRQTAMENGVAKSTSLRSQRAIMRGLTFEARLDASDDLSDQAEMLLALACRALRRLGSQRTRGRGRVDCQLYKTGQLVALDQLDPLLGVHS